MDKYGYIGIETLLNFCENSKDHAVTPNDFMRMNRVRIPEREKGEWISIGQRQKYGYVWMKCSKCGNEDIDSPTTRTNFCSNCGADMRGDQNG